MTYVNSPMRYYSRSSRSATKSMFTKQGLSGVFSFTEVGVHHPGSTPMAQRGPNGTGSSSRFMNVIKRKRLIYFRSTRQESNESLSCRTYEAGVKNSP